MLRKPLSPPTASQPEHLERLRVIALVLPALLLTALFALDYFAIRWILPPGESHLFLLAVGIAGVVAFSAAIFSYLSRLHAEHAAQNARLADLARALEYKQDQLKVLNAAGISLSQELASGAVLQRVVDLARSVAKARYAALGVFDERGDIVEFLTAGMSDDERARIGEPPRGRGILGVLQREHRPLRLADLSRHPASVGFPKHHPSMKSFLGVPILSRGKSLGNLYLTEKEGAAEFGQDDEEALTTLAAQAAIAIENARLYAQTQRIAVLEERHRIGMDLHDGVIQSLYGLGFVIEDAAERLDEEPDEARAELDRAVDRLNAAIADLRGYVLGLHPLAASSKPLQAALGELAMQVESNALLDVSMQIAPDAVAALDQRGAEAAFYIAADALANVARHARARRATLRLVRHGAEVLLEIADDGVGFDPPSATRGYGLANMRERARALGGRLRVESGPGRGTHVRAELPVRLHLTA